MTLRLSPLDLGAILVYLFAIAALGASFYRRSATARDYFLGGRTMGWLPAGISIVAADLSAITVMGSPAWTYKHDLELLWVTVGYPLMAPVAILVFVPFYSRLNLYTAYEYLERRFHVSVRLLISALFQMLRAWHVAVAVFGPSLVINLVTGLAVWKCVLILGLFTTFYTTLGGIKAVIWTDVIQFVTVTTGILLIFFTAVSRVPGGMATAFEVAKQNGKLSLVNLSTDPSQLTSIWACLLGGSVLALAPLATDQAVLQRLLTTRSQKDCQQSVIVQAVVVVPITLLLYLSGVALYSFYHTRPEGLGGLGNLDGIVPWFVMRELPRGIAGLVLACIFAASMAVMSAGINSLTTATTVDFYQRLFRPEASSEHYAVVGRVGTVVWGCVATGLALLTERAGDLMIAYTRISSVISGPMLGVFLLGMLSRRANTPGVLLGAFAGVVAVIATTLLTTWSWLYHGPVGAAVTLAVGSGASLISPPPDQARVRELVRGDHHQETTS